MYQQSATNRTGDSNKEQTFSAEKTARYQLSLSPGVAVPSLGVDAPPTARGDGACRRKEKLSSSSDALGVPSRGEHSSPCGLDAASVRMPSSLFIGDCSLGDVSGVLMGESPSVLVAGRPTFA